MRQFGIVCDWALHQRTPADLEKATDALIEKIQAGYDAVGKLDPSEVTFENCIKPLIDLERTHSTEENPIDFAQHCVEDKSLREASVAQSKRLNEFSVEMSMRKDIFDNVTAFKERCGLDALTAEQRRFVEREIVDGKRSGLHLDEANREKIKAIKKEISKLGTDFMSNLGEDTTFLEFTREELAGVPEDLVNSFEKSGDNKLKVTMKYPHFFPVSRKCSVPETRRKMENAYQSRCLETNTKILETLVKLRDEQAQVLGYKSHAAYIHELRMSKNPETVKTFLSGLATKLQPIWDEERKAILELKQAECEKMGYEYNGAVDFWDARYYMRMVEETRYSVDQEKLKEYFPMDKVTKGLLEIYQELLSLRFTKCEGVETWHKDVELFKVEDAASSEVMGYFFLDLHPRDGKYGHAAIFSLQPSCLTDDGKTRQPGVCAMMANFSKPTAEKPSLLDHGEVTTYFHEFGHVMHMICAQAETARFSGCHVERDFVEAPSQMLENWCWEKETLARMSGHYKDGSAIPEDLLEKLVASRTANAGGFNLRQIILATADQRFHSSGPVVDTMKTFNDTYAEILGILPIPGTNMPATWGHMVGYDAQYYGYMWSEVFSMDMFMTRFKKEGLLNPKVGMDYRNKVLRPGGSRDATDLLKDFLGREPNEQAFLESKGLKQ